MPVSTAALTRAQRGLVVLLSALCAAAALTHFLDNLTLRDLSLLPPVLVALAAAVGLLLARARGARVDEPTIALVMIAAAIVLTGVPELPAWASVDAFGKSPAFLYLALVVLAGLAWRGPRPGGDAGDAALSAFVVLSAFGGPFFVRASDEFHSQFMLLCLAALVLVRNPEHRSIRDVPFLPAYLAFLMVSLAATAVAVDKDRHLAGCLRILAAGVPLLLLGFGALDLERAWRLLRAHAAMVFAGIVAAAIVILEAGYHFRLKQAFAARLTLFGEDPNIIAPYFAVAPPLLLALLPASRRLRGRVAVGACLFAAAAGLWLTRSKAAQGGAVIGVAAMIALWGCARLRAQRPAKSTVALLVAGVLLAGAAGVFALRGRVAAELGDASMQFRLYLWGTAIDAIRERPLLGYGYLTADPLMAHAVSSDLDGMSKDTHPHNLMLAVTLGAGVLGALAFLWLVIGFVVRTAALALRLPTAPERALAAGCVGSALALLSANLLDQGLSLHTRLPLHLGLLLGVGALLALHARAPTPAAFAPTRRRRLPVTLLVALAALPVIAMLAADRLGTRAARLERAGSLEAALPYARAARWLNPLALSHGLREAQILEASRQPVAALERVQALSHQHPLAALPWDRISRLEEARREPKNAIDALQRAIALDPTGPLASTWKIREGDIYRGVGNQGKAEEAYAEAIRYSFESVHRVPWQHSPTDVREWFIKGPAKPIFLFELLGRNRALLPELVASDPVKARRLATTLVKTYMQFHRYQTARKIIAEYRGLTAEPWLPLKVLETELAALPDADKRGELLVSRPPADPAADVAVAGDPPPVDPLAAAQTPVGAPGAAADYSGAIGQSGIHLAEGERLLAAGDAQAALGAFERAIDHVYDMVAERTYLGRLVDGMLESHRLRKDLAGARVALRGTLYFHSTTNQRLERRGRFARVLLECASPAEAMSELESSAEWLPRLNASRGETVVREFSKCLVEVADADPALQRRVQALVARHEDSPAGWLLGAYVHFQRGDVLEFQRRLGEGLKRFPEWFRQVNIQWPTREAMQDAAQEPRSK